MFLALSSFDTLSPNPAHHFITFHLSFIIISDELGIIFCKSPPQSAADDANSGEATSSSEPHFILQEHKLGVSVHSVHPLINEARRAFPAAREDYERKRRMVLESDSTDQLGADGADLEAATERLMSVTRALLLVNADHGSAWNARKASVRDAVGVHGYSNVRQEIKARFLQMVVLIYLLFLRTCIVPSFIFRLKVSFFVLLVVAVCQSRSAHSLSYEFQMRYTAGSGYQATVFFSV